MRVIRLSLGIAVLAVVVSGAALAQPTGGAAVTVSATPLYLTADANRTPLATLPAGTVVRLLAKEGDWYRVVFRDQYLGDRTGYVLASNLRIDPSAARSPAARGPMPGAPPPSAVASAPAAAPVTRGPRGYVWLNASYQRETTGFTTTTTFTQNVESGSITSIYSGKHPILPDITVGGQVWRGLSINGAMTYTSVHSDAALSALVPHPFVFNAPRSVSGTATGLRKQELGLHVDAAWTVPDAGPVQITLFAGPSFFRVRQDLVTGLTTQETYPYDTAAFGSATVVDSAKWRVGGNGGIDLSVRVAAHAAVGAIARYSRADVKLGAAGTPDVAVRAGGLQVGAGLRFWF